MKFRKIFVDGYSFEWRYYRKKTEIKQANHIEVLGERGIVELNLPIFSPKLVAEYIRKFILPIYKG